MASTGTASNRIKYELAKGNIDLSADSIKICLMRSGYVFDKDTISYKKNFKTASTAATLTCTLDDQKITRDSGNFITEGFVIGNQITTDLTTNTGPFVITNVAALVLTVSADLVNEGPTAGKIVTADDELDSGFGYDEDTKVLTTLSLAEDDGNDRAEMTCDDVEWTVSGGSIGPSPGAILYDDSVSGDPVIGYIDFDGEKTASSGTFAVNDIAIRLE